MDADETLRKAQDRYNAACAKYATAATSDEAETTGREADAARAALMTALEAKWKREREETLDYGDPVDWAAEVKRVVVAVREFGPYTQLQIRRTNNAKKFAAELRSRLPAEVNRSVTFLVCKDMPARLLSEAPLPRLDLHWEYDYPPPR